MEDSVQNATVSEDASGDVLTGVIDDNEVEVEELSCFFFTVESIPRRWLIRIYSNRYPLYLIFNAKLECCSHKFIMKFIISAFYFDSFLFSISDSFTYFNFFYSPHLFEFFIFLSVSFWL